MSGTQPASAPEGGAGGKSGEPLKGLGRHGLMYALGIIVTKAIALVMLPIYTRYLTVENYGIIGLLTMTTEVISIVAGARIAVGIFHFYHKEASAAGKRAVLSTAVFLLAATYGMGTLAATVAAPWIADVVFGSRGMNVVYVRMAAATLFFEGVFLVPIAYLQLQKRSTLFVAVNLTKVLMQLTLNVILLIPLHMGLLGVMISSLSTNIVISGSLAFWLLRDVGVQVRAPLVRAFVRFGVPLMGMQVATLLITYGDRFFLVRAGGERQVGLFGLAYQFGSLLYALGYAPFERVWDPERFAIAKREDRDAIYARGWIFTNLLLVTFAVGLSLFGGDFIRLVAAPEFHPAAALVPILVFAYMLQIWAVFHQFGMLVSERTELYTVATWIAAAVAFAGYFSLVPAWLAFGAALTAVASRFARFALSYYYSHRAFPIRYDWAPVLRQCAVAVAVCSVAYALPQVSVPWSVAEHTGLVVLYGIGVWFFGLSDGDRDRLRRVAKAPRSAIKELMA